MADSAPEKHPDSGKEETACIEQFTIPMKEWENMKAQNLRILAALGESEKVDKAKGKKRKAKGQWDSDASSQKRRVKGQWDSDASSQESESEGESHEGSPHKKRRDNLHDDTLQIDVDEQIDELFANNECKNEEDDEDDSNNNNNYCIYIAPIPGHRPALSALQLYFSATPQAAYPGRTGAREQPYKALITPFPVTITRDSVTHTPHITIGFLDNSASYTRQYVFFSTTLKWSSECIFVSSITIGLRSTHRPSLPKDGMGFNVRARSLCMCSRTGPRFNVSIRKTEVLESEQMLTPRK